MIHIGHRIPYTLAFIFTVGLICFLITRTNSSYDTIRATAGVHAALAYGVTRLLVVSAIWLTFLFVFAQRLRHTGKSFFWLIAALVPVANLVVCFAMIFPSRRSW